MKRVEKNAALKKAAELLDRLLVTADLPAETAAEVIGVLHEIDAGMYIDHAKRGYHAAIKNGKINLDRVTDGA